MKKITDKWKGMRMTINYLGEADNKFGLKKKKVLLEEDKIHSLSDLRKSNKTLLQKIKTNKLSVDYMINSEQMKNNNNNNFELINIKDFEKTKNSNFFNYFKNVKYFNRINSYKRFMSSCHIANSNNNNKDFSKVETSDLNEKKKKKNNKRPISIKFGNNLRKKEFKLSKIDINKIIFNYMQDYKNDIESFNQKNRRINNKLKNHYKLKLNSQVFKKITSNSTINRKKKNINIVMNKDIDNYNRQNNRSSMNRTSNQVSLRDSSYEINSNLMFQNQLYNLKYNLDNESHIGEAITISKKNFFYNKINLNQARHKSKLFIKKASSSIDASTNTDFFKKNK